MRWKKGIIYGIRMIFVINAVYLAFNMKFLLVGLLIGSLALTFIPEVFTRLTHVKITETARLIYALFILCSQWLGTYLRLYDSIIWWDIMLHFSSGILLGYVGLLILIWADRVNMQTGRHAFRIVALFAFLVSVSGAVFWEIFEFLSDVYLGSNTQLGSLRDTMEDMIFGTLGALVFVVYLVITERKKSHSSLARLIELNQNDKKDE